MFQKKTHFKTTKNPKTYFYFKLKLLYLHPEKRGKTHIEK